MHWWLQCIACYNRDSMRLARYVINNNMTKINEWYRNYKVYFHFSFMMVRLLLLYYNRYMIFLTKNLQCYMNKCGKFTSHENAIKIKERIAAKRHRSDNKFHYNVTEWIGDSGCALPDNRTNASTTRSSTICHVQYLGISDDTGRT